MCEEAMKKGMPILKKVGFESAEVLPRTAVGFNSKAYLDLPPKLMSWFQKTGRGFKKSRSLKS